MGGGGREESPEDVLMSPCLLFLDLDWISNLAVSIWLLGDAVPAAQTGSGRTITTAPCRQVFSWICWFYLTVVRTFSLNHGEVRYRFINLWICSHITGDIQVYADMLTRDKCSLKSGSCFQNALQSQIGDDAWIVSKMSHFSQKEKLAREKNPVAYELLSNCNPINLLIQILEQECISCSGR